MLIVDMHCDTISELWKKREAGEDVGLLQNNLHVDLNRMKKSGYMIQNFALFVQKEKCGNPWNFVQKLLALYEEEIEKNEAEALRSENAALAVEVSSLREQLAAAEERYIGANNDVGIAGEQLRILTQKTVETEATVDSLKARIAELETALKDKEC